MEQHLWGFVWMVHVHVHVDIVDRRRIQGRCMLVEKRLVRKVLGWETRLVMHVERVDVLKRLMGELRLHMVLECIEGRRLMASIQGSF
jgi:hypothetical protein